MVVFRKTDFFVPISQEFPVHGAVKYTGEVGIEIEVEARNGTILPQGIPSYWAVHHDGSLRGEAAEYVFIKPASRKVFRNYLDYLVKQLDKFDAKPVMSPRTSVHVHINMSDKSLVQCYNYVLCYLIVEHLMSKYAGPSRVGNVFCLRASDAEYMVDFMAIAAKKGRFAPDKENLRYSSVNVCAITKFNSVEFRALRGTLDMDVVEEWTQMLLSIKDASLTYDNPRQIMEDFSRLGPAEFLRKLVPNQAHILMGLEPDYQDKMWDAMRLVQEIAYASDWKPKEKKKGRLFQIEPDEEPEPEWRLEDE